jgi:hypothetical protein
MTSGLQSMACSKMSADRVDCRVSQKKLRDWPVEKAAAVEECPPISISKVNRAV